ncbi:MAG TPA: ABC transporter permease [Syntrophales bacterium]|jgi:phospholipid/cholesterol/gamma-HCH transport system permease protein|nr:ABC transporter permease [Syntrophales bacterium]HPC32673.1 ABC transporter permease [Syntrophales bacterium]HRR47084.1 ABC transporter permease [Syntrophales bacterium]HRU88542.1 ABC transporter permease [Syntrophales bacterium]
MIQFSRPEPGRLLVSLRGGWQAGGEHPPVTAVYRQLDQPPVPTHIAFDCSALTGWDSILIAFLVNIIDYARQRGIAVDRGGLPPGIAGLLKLAYAVPERAGARQEQARPPLPERLGRLAYDSWQGAQEVVAFIGEATAACGRMLRGRARFRRRDLLVIIQECGIQALPIVSLISVLVGLILAFVGSIQLSMFGAQIYIANLVGIGIFREMGAIMTGVIMAGRTGAAFAAQLGTMQTTEEIDALRTLGIPPMDYLVLPRMIALFLMMPLLCLYADFMGVLGGFIVGVTMLDLNFSAYYNQTKAAIRLNDLWVGLFMSAVFGILVAGTGCLRGLQCERSAAAVGKATTSAVVTGIVAIVVATAAITVLCNILGI